MTVETYLSFIVIAEGNLRLSFLYTCMENALIEITTGCAYSRGTADLRAAGRIFSMTCETGEFGDSMT